MMGDGDPATAEAPATPRGRGAGDHRRTILGIPARGAPRVSRPRPSPAGAVGRWLSRPNPGRPTGSAGGEKERVATWVRVHSSGLPSSAAAGLIITAGAASASPQPTISEVKAKINKLTAQENVLIQRYDQVSQDLSGARQRLKMVNQELAKDQAAFHEMQGRIAQVASFAY